jgi:thiol-disulfide isomerase/thioredoxin
VRQPKCLSMSKEALIYSSSRHMPGSRVFNALDAGMRRHDKNGINEKSLKLNVLLMLICSLLLAGTAVRAETGQPGLGYQFTPLEPLAAAPDFTLDDMDDEPFTLSDYRGKVVLINFWATWCPPCRKEMPALEALYKKLGGESFAVLAVNQWEDPDHVFAYTGELNVFPTFPILFDPDSAISEKYRVKGLPTSFLIDKQGRLVYRAVGGRDFDHPEVEKLIRVLQVQP